MTHTPLPHGELVVAASHAEISTEVGRWLVHDIRGSLQGVTLTLALLGDPDAPPLDPALRDALAAASADLGGIVELADRLLRIPRLDAEPAPVVVRDVLQDAARFLARRRARVTLSWPDDPAVAALPPVAMHPDQLLHVLLAMLTIGTRTASPGGELALTAAGTDCVELTLVVTFPAGDPRPIRPDDVRLAASRLLLERDGGDFSVSPAAGSTTLRARLPAWRGGR